MVEAEDRSAGFLGTDPFLFFDYFRVPYRISSDRRAVAARPGVEIGRLTWTRGSGAERPALYWPIWASGRASTDLPVPGYRLGDIRLFARILTDDPSGAWLAALGPGWSKSTEITDGDGQRVSAVWTSHTGDVFLPFDPGEAMQAFWSEDYRAGGSAGGGKRLRSTLLSAYYLVRPALPRRVQIALRRVFSRLQRRVTFPAWPVEASLHELYTWLFGIVAEVAGEPVPYLAPWPAPHTWALVLSHDVETAAGAASLPRVRDLERSNGFRSSWNFVPERYEVDDDLVNELQSQGFEVGLHGLRHDGRDLDPRLLESRLPEMRRYAERWHAVGFRSPATHRAWDVMPTLGFEYDSSYPDTDPFEPQPGGCCTWLPFFNQDMIELPITMTQDHTLFVILRARNEQAWLDKAEYLKERSGLVLMLTHPDYLLDPAVLGAYERFLTRYAADRSPWHALPAEVAAWWRRRSASSVELDAAGEWRVIGAAHGEAQVAFAIPAGPYDANPARTTGAPVGDRVWHGDS